MTQEISQMRHVWKPKFISDGGFRERLYDFELISSIELTWLIDFRIVVLYICGRYDIMFIYGYMMNVLYTCFTDYDKGSFQMYMRTNPWSYRLSTCWWNE